MAASRVVPNVDDGTYEVGKVIPPGTWRITDPKGGCYWERTGASGDILDNDFITAAKQIDVRVRTTDAFFTSKECGIWFKIS